MSLCSEERQQRPLLWRMKTFPIENQVRRIERFTMAGIDVILGRGGENFLEEGRSEAQ